MNSIFIDTSAFIALFVNNDAKHTPALKIFDKLKKEKTRLYTSDYIIDETITTILNRGNHAQAVSAGESLSQSSIIEILYVTEDIFKHSLKFFKKYKDKKFNFTDVSSFVLMKKLDIKQAFTFDNDFIQAGFNTIS